MGGVFLYFFLSVYVLYLTSLLEISRVRCLSIYLLMYLSPLFQLCVCLCDCVWLRRPLGGVPIDTISIAHTPPHLREGVTVLPSMWCTINQYSICSGTRTRVEGALLVEQADTLASQLKCML